METKLLRIAELAKSHPVMKFTSLAHMLNEDALKQCHNGLPNKKETGVNRTTKEEYGKQIDIYLHYVLDPNLICIILLLCLEMNGLVC
jgi:hypothetical protein